MNTTEESYTIDLLSIQIDKYKSCLVAFSGQDLRMKGLNRIGNLVVPNDNYCKFEDWVMPILDQMVEEQKTQVKINCHWSSSSSFETALMEATGSC